VLTLKNDTLDGVTLLLVQPLSSSREPVGRVIVAADSVGAGVGEHVFFVRGKEASLSVLSRRGAGRRRHCRHRRSMAHRVVLDNVMACAFAICHLP
jgi:microcompartment protein CcmK/EutM